MRDLLQDALGHRDDGYGRAQKFVRRELPKRFYAEAGTAPAEGGFAVTLDGRPVQTPGRVRVVVPERDLAEAMAAEWAAQGEHVDPGTMPVVRLVNSALEGGAAAIPALREDILRFAGNDLLLYRADSPRELVLAQEAAWDAVLVALARRFSLSFRPTFGIVHEPQPPETLARLAAALDGAGLIALTALASITGLTGSGLLAIAFRHGLAAPDDAWAAAHVDEDFNIRQWGEDAEAAARRAARRAEFDAAVRVLRIVEEAMPVHPSPYSSPLRG